MKIIRKLFSRKENSDKAVTKKNRDEVSGIDMIVNKACKLFEENFSSVLSEIGSSNYGDLFRGEIRKSANGYIFGFCCYFLTGAIKMDDDTKSISRMILSRYVGDEEATTLISEGEALLQIEGGDYIKGMELGAEHGLQAYVFRQH